MARSDSPIVFSAAWFVRHQRVLLGLLQTPIVGGAFRAALGISARDVGYRRRIVYLGPHAYAVQYDDGTYALDVRTHAKFAKRLRLRLDPIWRAAHAWDRVVANPLIPALNVGFDTLTVFPDPGNPGTTTCDGRAYVFGLDLSLAALRSAPGVGADQASASTDIANLVASGTTNQFTQLVRGFFLFDTSPLGASVTISSAVFSLFSSRAGAANGLGEANLHVAGATPALNTILVAADYGQCQTTSFGSVDYPTFQANPDAYRDVALNASGLAAVSKTAVSKFSVQVAWDILNSFTGVWSSGLTLNYQCHMADETGTSNDPKLVVTFSVGGGGAVGRGYPSWQAVVATGAA